MGAEERSLKEDDRLRVQEDVLILLTSATRKESGCLDPKISIIGGSFLHSLQVAPACLRGNRELVATQLWQQHGTTTDQSSPCEDANHMKRLKSNSMWVFLKDFVQ